MQLTRIARKKLLNVLACIFVFAVLLAPVTAETPSMAPIELVRLTVQNEIKASDSKAKFMFKDFKQSPHGSQTKLMVETQQGMAGIVVAENGQPLSPERKSAELARVQRFVNNPDELKKKQKQEKDDSDRVTRIMKALPDAFLYQYDGSQAGQQGEGKAGDELIRLKFRPNPNYDPPSRVEQVLTGMQGTMLIDANRHRIALIDGTLVKDVGFGWGILGHLDHGGHFLVQQGEVGDNHWEITHMRLSFTGKVLFFKSINIKSNEVYSDFHPVPSDLNFAQGVELLKRQDSVMANSQPHDDAAK